MADKSPNTIASDILSRGFKAMPEDPPGIAILVYTTREGHLAVAITAMANGKPPPAAPIAVVLASAAKLIMDSSPELVAVNAETGVELPKAKA